ncbi:ATP-binding cassette domain-containing protein [Spirillospora sp. NPDC048911]|uniref:ABC transporter ATP-binding protein n=1 Tax=Spirillospora sp. NPDC048911 TaxID=3364527 RepID=UPI0037211901
MALRMETRGLSLRGSRGWVFRDVTATVPAGGLAAVSGIAGSGRTALLLTLGGRMEPTGGIGMIGDRQLGRGVQRVAALGVIAGVTELDPSLTVREHVSEALDLHEGIFGRWRGRKARIGEALGRVGLDVDPGTLVQDLAPDEAQLLGAALGLIGEPGLLLLDDVDEGLPSDRQHELWRRLRAIADSGVTVVATCHDPAPAEDVAQIIELEPSR